MAKEVLQLLLQRRCRFALALPMSNLAFSDSSLPSTLLRFVKSFVCNLFSCSAVFVNVSCYREGSILLIDDMEQYEILEQIGKGAFGSALLVKHKHEKKKYVLKKIRLARQTERSRRSAHQEVCANCVSENGLTKHLVLFSRIFLSGLVLCYLMELLSKLRNPFIVKYKDSWVERAEAIKKASGVMFPEEKLCKWLVQLLMALDYLHVNHILHRDVKSHRSYRWLQFCLQVINDESGDFGLAKMLTSDDLTSSVVGTPSYMCPELLADIPYGSKSDIWSLGCCIYEMSSLKPAFKAFVLMSDSLNMVSLNRGLVKSMLRKNPELRPSAAELLGHQHLQPYVLKVHRKINSPRRNTLPGHWPESNYIKETRFLKSEDDPVSLSGYKWHSFSNDRTLNPSVSGAEQDSLCSTLEIDCTPDNYNQRLAELCVGDNHDVKSFHKPAVSRISSYAKTPKLTASKTSATSKKSMVPSKNHKTLPVSHNMKQLVHTTRRASLPLPRSCAQQPPRRPSIGLLDHVNSPNISVNSPRIDRIAEFPLASYEDQLFPVDRSSSNSVQGSSVSPPCGNDSTLIEKCTIKVCDTACVRPSCTDAWQGIKRSMLKGNDGEKSVSSDQNATAGASSYNSFDLHRRQFDTSSFQQRAEALEGLLEFSARLLQQERYGELGVLLKPFGPEKASPRETAIWLSKSFKENTFNREQSS
ncbi:hypothetical protein Fmac_007064 [Flemingia macrophylla]|uniref:Protein kinase domain-containing protein n=1 Tax=Flemingia macrophylla TaxID=520843 RepID=A0ABD1NCE7_9FABA